MSSPRNFRFRRKYSPLPHTLTTSILLLPITEVIVKSRLSQNRELSLRSSDSSKCLDYSQDTELTVS